MNTNYELTWQGPFRWYEKERDVFSNVPEAKQPGIYLWTVSIEKENFVYYVGETGNSFAERFSEHAREYRSVIYEVYDTAQFAKGVKHSLWNAVLTREHTERTSRKEEFRNRFLELAPHINELLALYKVLLAPLHVEERIRQRIEAAIALTLYDHKNPRVSELQHPVSRRHYLNIRRKENELPVVLTMRFPEPIAGLPEELLA